MAWPDFNAIPTDQYLDHRESLLDAYRAVRGHSHGLTQGFSEAEQQLQSMPDASPTKWHLGHTTWFFETFILARFKPGFQWQDERFRYLFNSYYHALGAQYPRPKRGMIVDPDLGAVWSYRERIDDDLDRLVERCEDEVFSQLAPTLVLGLNHEQQHQELIRTDIKHALYQAAEPGNGGRRKDSAVDARSSGIAHTGDSGPDADPATSWTTFDGGVTGVGHAGEGFCFDNELARHEVLLEPFEISNRLVTARDWLEFMADGGYEQPLLWLSDGWQWRQENAIEAPLYWRKLDGRWHRFTLHCRSGALAANADDPNGAWIAIDPDLPVRHISYYEADAFAEWRGSRLPREAEWEAAVPQAGEALADRGEAWEWTQSAYSAYPGFRPAPGLAGEYNGKFMVNQMVLRGRSPATAALHSRPSYRNFFYPGARWQYSGLRLARDFGS